jgi:cytochrome c peroxidase
MKRLFAIVSVFAMGTALGWGQRVGSLKNIRVPQPSNLAQYVRDSGALVVLGKVLFWDMQLGSDGRTACATCHFHAGAHHRTQNQLSNPAGAFPANYTLSLTDFPFHQLADIKQLRVRGRARQQSAHRLGRRLPPHVHRSRRRQCA